jgi:acid phosphatase
MLKKRGKIRIAGYKNMSKEMIMRLFTYFCLLFTLSGCTTLKDSPQSNSSPPNNGRSEIAEATAPAITPHNNLNSVLWVQTSSEYRANALQTYRSATQNLQAAIDDNEWTAAIEQTESFKDLPPAVVLDVDETVLDNAAYQAQLVIDRQEFKSATWDLWIKKKEATAIPGAVAFIKAAQSNGLAVLLITNRECKKREGNPEECPQEAETLDNLKSEGITGISPASLLLKNERAGWGSEKESRRIYLAKQYRLIMLLGDDLGDFLPGVKSDTTPADREKLVDQYQEYWGIQWYMLPNPNYGSWQRVLNKPITQYLRGY